VVRVLSVNEEDLRRSHRERDRLVRERTAHINRIKGLLFGQSIRGINVKNKCKTLQIDKLVTGDGRPLPPRLANEIIRARRLGSGSSTSQRVRSPAGLCGELQGRAGVSDGS
jgi:transposase